jgi:CheY-like chemotaxis protein
MKKLSLFQSGTGLVSSHAVDGTLVDVEAGASLARHIPRLQAILAIAAAAALPSRWSPRVTRAAAAEDFGPYPRPPRIGARMEPAAWLSYHGLMRTVLIVDDHPTFRATARALLEAEGFDVVGEAEDGLSALAEIERLRPEIVLLDVQLPDIDGFEVAARLARDGAAPQIVLTSSRDATDFGPLVAESGARGFVAKDELSGAAIAALVQ